MRIITPIAVAAFAAWTITQDPQRPNPAPQQAGIAAPSATLETRVADLERRVSQLEGKQAEPAAAPDRSADDRAKGAAGEFAVPVTITSKVYDPTKFHESIRWDATYDFSKLPKDARAIKGTVEFTDLFGELKFAIGNTITDAVRAGGSFSEKGVGFEFNEFRDQHKWMLAVDLKDLRARFRVKQVIYADGTQADFK